MTIRATVAALALLLPASLAADPLEGVWLTTPGTDGHRGLIQVAPCGSKLCGTVIGAVLADGSKASEGGAIGRQIIWDTVHKGNGVYSGKVYAPDRDKTYTSKLILTGNGLSVSGCFMGVCREDGIWARQ
jgi:uncharacterized protein (DUF2147 family)